MIASLADHYDQARGSQQVASYRSAVAFLAA